MRSCFPPPMYDRIEQFVHPVGVDEGDIPIVLEIGSVNDDTSCHSLFDERSYRRLTVAVTQGSDIQLKDRPLCQDRSRLV